MEQSVLSYGCWPHGVLLTDLEGAVRFTPEVEQLYNNTPWQGDFPVRENSLQTSPIIAAVRIVDWMPGRVRDA